MENKKSHINREAHKTSKGFRLQKLRAVELMVDSQRFPDNTVLYWAIEKKEDVFQAKGKEIQIEEDKAYNKDSSFTFNSKEVRKALVSFIDLWIHYEYSSLLKFNFYSSNKIGAESKSGIVKKENISLPEGKMIELISGENLSNELIAAAKTFILYEIKEQYGINSSVYVNVTSWTVELWKNFFNLINWSFEQPDEEELNQLVLRKIKDSIWFSASEHNGMEDFIKSKLLDELDKRQTEEDYLNKVISKAQVQLIFENAKRSKDSKVEDALWKMWKNIPEPIDKRNIEEKIKSVWCEDVDAKVKFKLMKKATEGGVERESFSGDNEYMALRYRIYTQCDEVLEELMCTNNLRSKYSLDGCMKYIFSEVNNKINALSDTFKYKHKNEDLINNVILELFDNCYLAFDDE